MKMTVKDKKDKLKKAAKKLAPVVAAAAALFPTDLSAGDEKVTEPATKRFLFRNPTIYPRSFTDRCSLIDRFKADFYKKNDLKEKKLSYRQRALNDDVLERYYWSLSHAEADCKYQDGKYNPNYKADAVSEVAQHTVKRAMLQADFDLFETIAKQVPDLNKAGFHPPPMHFLMTFVGAEGLEGARARIPDFDKKFEYLLTHTDLNAKDEEYGQTPLMYLVSIPSEHDHTEVIKKLVEHGADLSQRSDDSWMEKEDENLSEEDKEMKEFYEEFYPQPSILDKTVNTISSFYDKLAGISNKDGRTVIEMLDHKKNFDEFYTMVKLAYEQGIPLEKLDYAGKRDENGMPANGEVHHPAEEIYQAMKKMYENKCSENVAPELFDLTKPPVKNVEQAKEAVAKSSKVPSVLKRVVPAEAPAFLNEGNSEQKTAVTHTALKNKLSR